MVVVFLAFWLLVFGKFQGKKDMYFDSPSYEERKKEIKEFLSKIPDDLPPSKMVLTTVDKDGNVLNREELDDCGITNGWCN